MKIAWLVVVLGLVFAPVVGALAQQTNPQMPPAGARDQRGVDVDAKSLIGSTVRGQDGKDIGKVANIMVDTTTGAVTSVLVSMGGVAGIGARDVAVPWKDVKIGRDGRNLVVAIPSDVLQSAPAKADEHKGSEGSASPKTDEKK
jgi:sporulation protein YlmC with PRC-barrel domain